MFSQLRPVYPKIGKMFVEIALREVRGEWSYVFDKISQNFCFFDKKYGVTILRFCKKGV